MTQLRFSRHAKSNLQAIWLDIAAHSPGAADRILDRLHVACGHLRNHPHLGRAHPEISSEARVLVVDRWLILYAVVDSVVHVKSVTDGRRDRANLREDFGRDDVGA